MPVAAAKTGPDYIDTAFLTAAAGSPAVNLDPWAMRPAVLEDLAGRQVSEQGLVVVEGAMGLFDGADGGAGSTASLAGALGLPVVLVVDAAGQAQSVAALARGFASHDRDLQVAGVILNRVGSERHERLMRAALCDAGIRVFGALARSERLTLPSRHLGLNQASEHDGLARFIDDAAATIRSGLDLDGLVAVAGEMVLGETVASGPGGFAPLPPPGQRIAVAADEAFGFAYDHLMAGWRRAGADIVPFSPLGDEAPDRVADAVFLPGGYPELHAGRLAASRRFLGGLVAAAKRGARVHGECGGYMVLGDGLIDGQGNAHAMAGLLRLETSFAERRLSLGYRRACVVAGHPSLPSGGVLRGHEFHYATTRRETGDPLYEMSDAAGRDLGRAGLVVGTVSGSFLHVIDMEEPKVSQGKPA